MKQKTNKAIAKRFRVTGKKKIMKRSAGQDHFNGRDTGKQTRQKRNDQKMSKSFEDTIKTFMPYEF